MKKFTDGLYNKLFIEMAKTAIYVEKFGFKSLQYPKTEIKELNILLSKYFDYILEGLNPKFILIEMEIDKAFFTKDKKSYFRALLIIQELIFKISTVDIEYILELSRYYTDSDVYDTIIKLCKDNNVTIINE